MLETDLDTLPRLIADAAEPLPDIDDSAFAAMPHRRYGCLAADAAVVRDPLGRADGEGEPFAADRMVEGPARMSDTRPPATLVPLPTPAA